MRPTQNLSHQQTAYAAVPVRRSRPQGDQLRSGSVVRIEECAYDAARFIAIHREEPGAEGMRSIFERAKAHRFEQKRIRPRDRRNLNQGEFSAHSRICVPPCRNGDRQQAHGQKKRP